jgi:ferredoxin-type protein NapH
MPESVCLKEEENDRGIEQPEVKKTVAHAGGKVKRRMAAAVKVRQGKQLAMGIVFIAFLIGGWFVPAIGYFIPVCMVAGIGIAFFRGRQWCNWYCPRGSFADSLLKKISPARPMPQYFRTTGLRVAVLSFLMAVLAFRITALWPDFYETGKFFMVLLTVTTAVGVVLAMVFHHRAWCAICPIGSLSSWVGRNKYPLTVDQDRCVECGACAEICPMQLAPEKLQESSITTRGDCVKCGLCVAACGKEALKFSE